MVRLPRLKKLPRSFYERDTIVVARELLGKYLVCVCRGRRRIGRIVEVEAYLGTHDLASHSSKGLTARTRVMFGPPGRSYVYLVYGVYHCMNVVTEPQGHAAAVLLRALEPVANMKGPASGPGLLCKAMGLDMRFNDRDLLGKDIYIASSADSGPVHIVRRPRVGVDYSGKWAKRLLRFYIRGNEHVSRL